MLSTAEVIQFTVCIGLEEFAIETFPNEYYSLMALITSKFALSDFGICNGMGSCGTCEVMIDGSPAFACEIRVNEELHLARIVLNSSVSRL